MIKPELVGVLTIQDKSNELVAVVYNDLKTRNQTFYSVKKMGVDDIKSLLEKANEKED